MSDLLKVSSNPHVRSKASTTSIMLLVVISLFPAAGFGIYHFGIRAFWIIALTVVTCVLTELVFELICRKKITIRDCSAIVTGMLLALNLPVTVPFWIPVVGGVFAILVVKMLFGGLGQNFMNPALGARCFLLLSFASIMTNYEVEGITSPTPLVTLRAGGELELMDLIIGNTGGTIGETSLIALVAGGCILLLSGVINLRIPAMYVISFAAFLVIFGGNGLDYNFVAAHIASGGLMLGAIFMATDYATRPITRVGQYVYGILLGILTGIFRIFGASPEGVSYAIIFGNLLVPLIEKATAPKAFGKGGRR